MAVERKRSDPVTRYLQNQVTELGNDLDMGMVGDFWFLASITGQMEGPVIGKGNIAPSPGNSDQELRFGHTEFDMAQQEDTCVALMKPCV